MTRTQIQLPDELYRRAKEVAEAREVSLAELIRNGLELLLTSIISPTAEQGVEPLPIVQLPFDESAEVEYPEWSVDSAWSVAAESSVGKEPEK